MKDEPTEFYMFWMDGDFYDINRVLIEEHTADEILYGSSWRPYKGAGYSFHRLEIDAWKAVKTHYDERVMRKVEELHRAREDANRVYRETEAKIQEIRRNNARDVQALIEGSNKSK